MSEELDLLIASVASGNDQFTDYFKRKVLEKMQTGEDLAVTPPVSQAPLYLGPLVIEKAPTKPTEPVQTVAPVSIPTGRFSPVVERVEDYIGYKRGERPGHYPAFSASGANLIDDVLSHWALNGISTESLALALSVPEPNEEIIKIRQLIIDNTRYPKQMLVGLLFAVCGLDPKQIVEATGLQPSAVSSYLSTTRRAAGLATLSQRQLSTSTVAPAVLRPRPSSNAFSGELIAKSDALANRWPRVPEQMRKTGPNSFVLSQVIESTPFFLLTKMWPKICATKLVANTSRQRPRITNEQFAMAVMYRAHGFSTTDYRVMHTRTFHKRPELFVGTRQMEMLFTIYDSAMWDGLRDMINEHQFYITYPGFALLVGRSEDYQG
jgi:hypothetical protein